MVKDNFFHSKNADAAILKANWTCQVCGKKTHALIVHPILPPISGGKDEPDNFLVLCVNCNNKIHRSYELTEMDFLYYLQRLLEKNKDFRNVNTEVPFGEKKQLRADLIAEEKIEDEWKTIVIEVKKYESLTRERINTIIGQLVKYKEHIGNRKLILAIPGELPESSELLFKKINVEIWDLRYLATRFSKQIINAYHPILQRRLLMLKPASKILTIEQKLINQLKSCPRGKKAWFQYQKLIENILKHLFCPPLEDPIPQSYDAFKTNIRDFILPNYVENGFWLYLRSRYSADFIVIDAKNYKGDKTKTKVGKEDILQITNYLKHNGVGLFGIIICRNVENNSSLITRREKWIADRKLVIILTDEDIEKMLIIKSSGGAPEDIIKQKIEDFRLKI